MAQIVPAATLGRKRDTARVIAGTLRAVVLLLRRLDVSLVPSDTKFHVQQVSNTLPGGRADPHRTISVKCS